MPERTATNETAAERYGARQSDIARLLDVLQMELERHAAEAKADPGNSGSWARANDLGKVREGLIQLVAFMSNMEPERVEAFLNDAE